MIFLDWFGRVSFLTKWNYRQGDQREHHRPQYVIIPPPLFLYIYLCLHQLILKRIFNELIVICIIGKHEVCTDQHGLVTLEFRRRVPIPKGFNPGLITSSLTPDGHLTIMAPKFLLQSGMVLLCCSHQSEFVDSQFKICIDIKLCRRSKWTCHSHYDDSAIDSSISSRPCY